MQKPACRFSIPLSPLICIQYEGICLLSLCPFVSVGWCGLFIVCFDCVLYTSGPLPAELVQLANLKELRLTCNQLTGTPSPLSTDVHSIQRNRLAFRMPFHTRGIVWLAFFMFWLRFTWFSLKSRNNIKGISNPSEPEESYPEPEPTYWFFLLSFPLLDLCSLLSFLIECKSGVTCLLVVCFDWVLYTPGPIPVELGQLANLEQLALCENNLTGTPFLFLLTCIQY